MKMIAVIVALLCMAILLKPLTVWAMGINNYGGKDYSSSKEKVEELEGILKDRGYVCVTSGCTENEEWTETLLANDSVAGTCGAFLDSEGTDYKMYVDEFGYEQFVNNEINANIFVNEWCYGISYYEFNHASELGSTDGVVGDELDYMGIKYGFITVYLNVDDTLKENDNLIYSVILVGQDDGKFYDLSSSSYSANGYVLRTKLPVGRFKVYSAFADNEHTVSLDSNTFGDGWFAIQENTNKDLIIDFRPMVPDEEIAGGEKTAHNADYTTASDTDTKVLMEDGTTISRVVEEEAKRPAWVSALLNLGLFVAIAVVIGVPALILYNRMRDRRDIE